MKKSAFSAVLLLILLTGLLSACSGQKAVSADTMEGSYRLVDAAGEGSAEFLELKDGVRLEVRADNTATLSLMKDSHELRFDAATGICTSFDDDQEVPYTFDGTRIVLDTELFRMVFER